MTDAGQQDMSGLFRGTDGTHPEPKGRAADWTEETSEPASERRGKLGGLKRSGGEIQYCPEAQVTLRQDGPVSCMRLSEARNSIQPS